MGYEDLKRVTAKYPSSHFSSLQRKKAEESSHQALKKVIEKRMTTAIIGTLDAIEKELGSTWGHGKQANVCSPEELQMREKWNALRKTILDKAHGQKRIALDELDGFTVRWNRTVRILPVYERKVKND